MRLREENAAVMYEATLVPWFALTRLRQNNRLFHDQNVKAQTSTVFEHYRSLAKWRWRVSGTDAPFTMATQWMESDHNYVSRRLESAGFSYYYEHTDKGHLLHVVSDTRLADAIEGTTVRYHSAGGPQDEDAIGQWAPKRMAASAQVTVSGFDFKRPKAVHSKAPTVGQLGELPKLEVHHYAGHYGFKPGEASALAELQMKEIEARAHHFEARGNCTRMVPGHIFTLTDHFEHKGEDAQFLILQVHHHATNNYLQTDKADKADPKKMGALYNESPRFSWRLIG